LSTRKGIYDKNNGDDACLQPPECVFVVSPLGLVPYSLEDYFLIM